MAESNRFERFNEIGKTIDSVFVYKHDSIYVRESADMMYIDRWNTKLVYKTRIDTLIRTDTVFVDKKVKELKTEIVEVFKVSGIQNFQIYGFRILLVLATVIFILSRLNIWKKILSLVKRLF
jgi:hypothetical protein